MSKEKEVTETTPPKGGSCCCFGGCCTCGAAKAGDEWGMIPSNKRKCRDIFCLVLFSVFWAGMLAIGGIGLKYGEPERLVYGTDYQGKICGSDEGLKEKMYVTYPRTNEDFIANLGKSNPVDYKFYGICVASCPGSLDIVCNYGVAETAVYTKTVKESCLTNPSYTAPNGASCSGVRAGCWITPQETSSMLFRCIPNYNISGSQSSTCTYPPGVTSSVDPRCIIVQDDKAGSVQRPAKPNLLFDQLNSGRQLWGRWFGDLARCWWVILVCSIGAALVLGFAWVTCLKYCTGFIVYTTIFLVVMLLSILTGFFYYKAGLVNVNTSSLPPSLNDQLAAVQQAADGALSTATAYVPQSWAENTRQYQVSYSAVSYVSTAVLVIVLCMIVALRKGIRTAIQVIKIATDALKSLPFLLFFPCTNVLCLGIFLIWWIFVAACLQSAGQVSTAALNSDVASGLQVLQDVAAASGSIVPANVTAALLLSMGDLNATLSVIEDMPVMNYLLIYHVVGLLWTVQFIQGVAAMTVAGAVGAWYFSQLPKEYEGIEDMEKLRFKKSRFTICDSLGRTVRYYLGSVAFGSLLIAIIQFIRIVFLYIQKKLEPQAKNNANMRFLLCCIQCCLKCLQTLVEMVTRNAYIFVAIKGTSFCGSGKKVFGLIMSHGREFVAVNVLGEVIMFLGKIVIAVACAWLSYLLLDRIPDFQPGGKSALSSTWLPVLVTLFFAYAIASGFMMIFDLTVDSVLVCYVTDIDENAARNQGSAAHKVAIHMHSDKLISHKNRKALENSAGKGENGNSGHPKSSAGLPRVIMVAPKEGNDAA